MVEHDIGKGGRHGFRFAFWSDLPGTPLSCVVLRCKPYSPAHPEPASQLSTLLSWKGSQGLHGGQLGSYSSLNLEQVQVQEAKGTQLRPKWMDGHPTEADGQTPHKLHGHGVGA